LGCKSYFALIFFAIKLIIDTLLMFLIWFELNISLIFARLATKSIHYVSMPFYILSLHIITSHLQDVLPHLCFYMFIKSNLDSIYIYITCSEINDINCETRMDVYIMSMGVLSYKSYFVFCVYTFLQQN